MPRAALQQAELVALPRRLAKQSGVELGGRAAMAQAEALAGELEADAQHLCIPARAGLAAAPLRVVFLAAMHLGDQRHDVLGPARHMRLEPFAEESLQLVRQAEQHIARGERT